MVPRKRVRTSSSAGGSSDSTAAPFVELDGGEPCPSGLIQLWRSDRLTDTVVEVEGRSFAAHKAVLAGQCDFFNRHYDNEHMRDVDRPKLLEHVTAAAFEPLLAFLYEGKCSFEESLLAPVLRAANYLGIKPVETAAAAALIERLSPSNTLAMWTWGDELKLPELSEAAKVTALKGFDEVEKFEEATLAQMQALVADDRLTAKNEEMVFSSVVRFAEAKQPAEADLLVLLRDVRFPLMSKDFLQQTVRNWRMLETMEGQRMLFDMMVGGSAPQSRRGFVRPVPEGMQESSSDILRYATWKPGCTSASCRGHFWFLLPDAHVNNATMQYRHHGIGQALSEWHRFLTQPTRVGNWICSPVFNAMGNGNYEIRICVDDAVVADGIRVPSTDMVLESDLPHDFVR